jgi:methylglutaconyl-CoA hydratase
MSDALAHDLDDRGIATLTLNRPHLHNAFDSALVAELTGVISSYGCDPRTRAIVLRGAGKSFSAGADLVWMRQMADYSFDENLADAAGLAGLMYTLDRCPKPTIGVIHGPAYGGGVGLAACVDTVIATDRASFCLSEVRLGIIPAAISPYVVAAIGERQARRYFVTAEVISAERAYEIGLVHELVPPEALEATLDRLLDAILQGAPEAQIEAKDLVFLCHDQALSPDLIEKTGRRIARRRTSAEGREGIGAFLDKRKPVWPA